MSVSENNNPDFERKHLDNIMNLHYFNLSEDDGGIPSIRTNKTIDKTQPLVAHSIPYLFTTDTKTTQISIAKDTDDYLRQKIKSEDNEPSLRIKCGQNLYPISPPLVEKKLYESEPCLDTAQYLKSIREGKATYIEGLDITLYDFECSNSLDLLEYHLESMRDPLRYCFEELGVILNVLESGSFPSENFFEQQLPLIIKVEQLSMIYKIDLRYAQRRLDILNMHEINKFFTLENVSSYLKTGYEGQALIIIEGKKWYLRQLDVTSGQAIFSETWKNWVLEHLFKESVFMRAECDQLHLIVTEMIYAKFITKLFRKQELMNSVRNLIYSTGNRIENQLEKGDNTVESSLKPDSQESHENNISKFSIIEQSSVNKESLENNKIENITIDRLGEGKGKLTNNFPNLLFSNTELGCSDHLFHRGGGQILGVASPIIGKRQHRSMSFENFDIINETINRNNVEKALFKIAEYGVPEDMPIIQMVRIIKQVTLVNFDKLLKLSQQDWNRMRKSNGCNTYWNMDKKYQGERVLQYKIHKLSAASIRKITLFHPKELSELEENLNKKFGDSENLRKIQIVPSWTYPYKIASIKGRNFSNDLLTHMKDLGFKNILYTKKGGRHITINEENLEECLNPLKIIPLYHDEAEKNAAILRELELSIFKGTNVIKDLPSSIPTLKSRYSGLC